MDTATIKVEPGTGENIKSGIPYAEIDMCLPDVKKECLGRSEIITQTAGKSNNLFV